MITYDVTIEMFTMSCLQLSSRSM